MKLFITGFIFGFLATLINRRFLKKAFNKAESLDPLRGYIVFNQHNFVRIALNIFVLGAAASKGVSAALGAFAGLLTQMLFYVYDIINLSRKG